MRLPVRHQQQSQVLTEQDHSNTVEKLLNNDFLQSFFNWQPFLGFEMMRPFRRMVDRIESWLPRTDVSETNNTFKVTIDLPSVDPKNVEITLEENTLVVSGKTLEEKETKNENFYQLERQQGEFRRSIDLPAGLDTDKVEAEAKHGSLYITIPKKSEAQRKQIKVNIKE